MTTTVDAGDAARRAGSTSSPPSPGMATSSRIRSGSHRAASSTPAAPSAAWPTTSKRPDARRATVSRSRRSSESSTSSVRSFGPLATIRSCSDASRRSRSSPLLVQSDQGSSQPLERVMAATKQAMKGAANGAAKRGGSGGKAVAGTAEEEALRELLQALRAAKDGDFTTRLPERRSSLVGQIGAAFNDLMEVNGKATKELSRVARVVGREG